MSHHSVRLKPKKGKLLKEGGARFAVNGSVRRKRGGAVADGEAVLEAIARLSRQTDEKIARLSRRIKMLAAETGAD
jgi:hypothetical protein